MKTKLAIFLILNSCFILCDALAGSATWNLNPTSNHWETAINWTPNTVPNDPSDIATFDVSNITSISLDGEFQLAEIVFNPGASAFTLVSGYPGLSFYGAGITNHSGVVQTLGAVTYLASEMNFYNSATAGENTVLFERGATVEDPVLIEFHDSSTAGSATINNYGNDLINGSFSGTLFLDSSTAANATVLNRANSSSGETEFSGTSKAGSATFICEGGAGSDDGGKMSFGDDSSAETATITVQGRGDNSGLAGSVEFSGNSNAGNAMVVVQGATARLGLGGSAVFARDFFDQGASTAGNATFIINGGADGGAGGMLSFEDGSLGGTAKVKLSGNGTLDLTAHDPGTLQIGSLAGTGIVLLGTTNLAVGTNNLTTAFSGNISDSSPGASLTKTGSGHLALTGANTYHGGTIVHGRGALFVNNVSGSGTGTGAVQVNSGALGGNGIIRGPVVIGNSGAGAARFMPGKNNRSPAVLTIGNTLSFNADATYLWLLDTVRAIASSVVAKGVTIDSTAVFTPNELQSAPLTAGTIFTVITNNGRGPILGTFSNLPDGGTIIIGSNTYQANYEAGDGNDLTLTVVQ